MGLFKRPRSPYRSVYNTPVDGKHAMRARATHKWTVSETSFGFSEDAPTKTVSEFVI